MTNLNALLKKMYGPKKAVVLVDRPLRDHLTMSNLKLSRIQKTVLIELFRSGRMHRRQLTIYMLDAHPIRMLLFPYVKQLRDLERRGLVHLTYDYADLTREGERVAREIL